MENGLRVMVDRDGDDHPMTKLVKDAQAILAAYLVPIGPSKADTIAQLVELFGGAPFFAALEQSQSAAPAADPMTALMERIDDVWTHEERMNKALADVRRMLGEIMAAKGGAA